MIKPAPATGSALGDKSCPKGVIPECFNRGSSLQSPDAR
jgi:hypothetical protein